LFVSDQDDIRALDNLNATNRDKVRRRTHADDIKLSFAGFGTHRGRDTKQSQTQTNQNSSICAHLLSSVETVTRKRDLIVHKGCCPAASWLATFVPSTRVIVAIP
jgi:hypothetical protein